MYSGAGRFHSFRGRSPLVCPLADDGGGWTNRAVLTAGEVGDGRRAQETLKPTRSFVIRDCRSFFAPAMVETSNPFAVLADTDVIDLASDEDDEPATLENTPAKLRARDANVPSEAHGLEGGPAAKRARVVDASNEATSKSEAETKSEAEPAPESETIGRRKRFFEPAFGEEKVLRFGPNTKGDGGWFDVYVANETQPRRVRGDVKAKLELREFTLEPSHEHASYNARASGKHEVRCVGVRDSALKHSSKTFAWTSPENVGRAANDDADVIVVPSKKEALELAKRRQNLHSLSLSEQGTDNERVDNFKTCYRLRDGCGCVSFTLRNQSSNPGMAACTLIAVTSNHWSVMQKRVKTTIVYDTYAYATRPNPCNGPLVLTSGREAVAVAKRWLAERHREVSEYLKANVNTLKEVYAVLKMSPGPGDRPKDGYWNAPTLRQRARVFVEEAGDDATTKMDMKNDGLNSYSAHTTEIFWKQHNERKIFTKLKFIKKKSRKCR